MPTARYKFVRGGSVRGFLSRNRASTDALNALVTWETRASGRTYSVAKDDDDELVSDLTWDEKDTAAGSDLQSACDASGVTWRHITR